MMIARQQTAAVQRTGRASASAPGRLPVTTPRSVIVRFKEGDNAKDAVRGVTDKLDKLDLTKQGPGKPMAQLQDEVRSEAHGEFKDRAPHDAAWGENLNGNNLLPVESAFTRQREIWAGRAGIVGFVAACFWETVLPDHPGTILQISKFTGLSPNAATIAILAIVGWNAFTALRPGSPTYSQENRVDAAQRPKGPPAGAASATSPKSFLGISGGWGFTKKNELFNGRIAMLGFTAGVINEILTGGLGPVAQVANYLNITPDTSYYSTVTSAFLAWTVFAIGLGYLTGNNGLGYLNGKQEDTEGDIY